LSLIDWGEGLNNRWVRNLAAGLALGIGMFALLVAFLWFVDRESSVVFTNSNEDPKGSLMLSDRSRFDRKAIQSESLEISRIEPAPGASVTRFETANIWFSSPVLGVDRMGLKANGASSLSVRGQGLGPYEIRFTPIESKSIEMVVHDENQLTDLSGRRIKLEKRWNYRAGVKSRKGMVKFGDLRLRVLDSHPSFVELPQSRFSILNDGEEPVNTTGWRVSFERLGLPFFILPSRLLLPTQRALLPLTELTPAKGEPRSFNPTSRGRLILFDSDLPPNQIDAVDYEFSAADLEISLNRVSDRWVFSREGASVGKGPRLPAVPQTNFLPGIYEAPISVTLSSPDPQDEIWYALDGSVPGRGNSLLYSKPIEIGKGMIIKAFSSRGQLTSAVASYSYLRGKGSVNQSLPTIGLSNVGFEEGSRILVFSDSEENAEVGSSVEILNREGELVGTGAAFLQPLEAQEVDSRQSRHAFSLRLSGAQQDAQRVCRGLRLPSISSGETIRFLPASTSSTSELIDWLVDGVGLERTAFSESGGFANVVVNGRPMGTYRMIQDGPFERQTVLVRGSQMTIIGDTASWLRIFDWILDSNFTERDTLDVLEQDFDLDWFAEYYLKRLFWGDRRWPNRGELITQDPVTQKWGFWPHGLKDAGSLWGEGSFEHAENKINASGAIFDSLLRSARFRRILADNSEALYALKSHVLQQKIAVKVGELDEVFGSLVRGIAKRFTNNHVQVRVAQIRHFLFQKRWASSVPSPELNVKVKSEQNSIGVITANEKRSFSSDKSDPVRFDSDLWFIESQGEKRVLIPVSDHHFGRWRSLEFEDRKWAYVQGLVGFDTRGFSGQEFQPQIYNLLHNRSSGAFLRTLFEVDLNDLSTVDQLVLRCRINDGFIAYLNGIEIVRFNVPEETHWNSIALSDIRGTAWRFREFDVSKVISQLKSGTNVLAVHAVNSMLNGSSFLIDYELVGRREFRGSIHTEDALTYSDPIEVNSAGEPVKQSGVIVDE
jgi:hypothetical protein